MFDIDSVLILFGVGFVAAVILAVASKVFYVEEDPRIEAVLDALPGANCGGCGYAGCEGYAAAVVQDPSVEANLCVAGSSETTKAVGALAGKAVTEADPLVSVRRCEKWDGAVTQRFEYSGLPSCASAASLGSGLGIDSCPYSCLGLGDCVKVCPFDALELKDNMVVVNGVRCIGCGKCIGACPRNVLELIPKRARVMVFCSTKAKAKEVTSVCTVGCITCTLCIKKCPAKAVMFSDGVIRIDHQKCLEYGDACNEACVSACSKRKIFKSLWYEGKVMPEVATDEPKTAKKEEVKPSEPATAPAEASATEQATEAKTEVKE